jgi:sigma-B regulation protein RsbU (phosphoserine phosphatase)
VLVVPDGIFWERLIPYPGVARNLLNVLSDRMRTNGEMLLARMKDRLELEHLQKELSIAHTIQLSMLPPGDRLFPDRTEVRAHAIMEPAKDVGGDFYDAFFATPDRLFVAIGDVSGKGVPAALFMAKTMTLIRMEAVRRRSPSAILEAVNRALCEGNDSGMFVTLFCGILEVETGLFSFANAGHNPPLLLGADGQCRFLNVKKGLVAGIMEGSRYPQVNLLMLPGESVLLYTDGVTEALDPREDLYTEERLVENVGKSRIDSPRQLVESIRASIADFVKTAPQADDIPMFALAYVGTGN